MILQNDRKLCYRFLQNWVLEIVSVEYGHHKIFLSFLKLAHQQIRFSGIILSMSFQDLDMVLCFIYYCFLFIALNSYTSWFNWMKAHNGLDKRIIYILHGKLSIFWNRLVTLVGCKRTNQIFLLVKMRNLFSMLKVVCTTLLIRFHQFWWYSHSLFTSRKYVLSF